MRTSFAGTKHEEVDAVEVVIQLFGVGSSKSRQIRSSKPAQCRSAWQPRDSNESRAISNVEHAYGHLLQVAHGTETGFGMRPSISTQSNP